MPARSPGGCPPTDPGLPSSRTTGAPFRAPPVPASPSCHAMNLKSDRETGIVGRSDCGSDFAMIAIPTWVGGEPGLGRGTFDTWARSDIWPASTGSKSPSPCWPSRACPRWWSDATRPDAPRIALWLALPAVAIMVLPLFARRRFPFAALIGYWLLAAGATFVDGRLIPFLTSVFVLGMVVAFFLGNLRDAIQARIGLAVVLVGAAIVVYNVPGHPASQLVFIPVLFGICWLAGFVAQARAEQTEAAEVRASRAEDGTRHRHTRGGGRGANPNRPRAARHRRPRRERDGAPGRCRPTQAPRRARRAARRTERRRAGWPWGPGRDASSAGRHARRRRRRRTRTPAGTRPS